MARSSPPPSAADGVKEWNITAEITDWEVTPGQVVKAWTFNGTVPGPTLRGEVGDRIRVKYLNKLPLGLDIHMHGMILPNDMDGVAPLTQELDRAGRDRRVRVHGDRSCGGHVPPPRPRCPVDPRWHVGRHDLLAQGRRRVHGLADPQGQDHLRGGDPGRHRAGDGQEHGAQRRRRDRPVAERQGLPGHRAVLDEGRRLGRVQLLQRGLSSTTRCTCTSSRSW